MGGDDYLAEFNKPGLSALRGYLASGQAVAFLGAGVSAPLYPLWTGLIGDLVDAAAGRMSEEETATCRALARESPEEVVEIIRQQLGVPNYREVLRQVLHARTDPDTGRSWTPVQELVCRCAFKAVVTTNYDPGITDARIRIRPRASSTGFTTWEDELNLDQWRTGDVFGESELPVLFAHGQHNRPDSIVLATTEYRRAYAGKLPHVLARLMDGHLIWIGFSFADQRIAAILREIADRTGTRIDPGAAPRHVAIMSWDPDAEGNDPKILARRAEIAYGARLILYPAPHGDHSVLARLLADLTEDRFPPAADLPARAAPAPAPRIPMRWVPNPDPVEHFTGRTEELARLDRWAADPQVSLVGVTAWGGAGKTALVTRWVLQAQNPGLRGVFAWSFYAGPSAEHWAASLLDWAEQEFGIMVTVGRLAPAVLSLLSALPLLLVLDGLERVQEGPAGDGFGRLLDGTLREVLAGVCQLPHGGLVLLTSRFPFADLETFDGGSARMLDVPPFTPAEGSALLAAAGASWLPGSERQDLVREVDGHALATSVLADLLAARPPASDLAGLRAGLTAATRTDARVGKVLKFYADRLSEPDRYLLAAVSLFARPIPAGAVIAVAAHDAFRSRLAELTPATIQVAVRDRLGGLATWHPDGTISVHPLVRDTFRRLVLDAAGAAANIISLAGAGLAVRVSNRAEGLRVVEAIELLVDSGQWKPADDLYRNRSGEPSVWLTLPAARLGQRAAGAFVATPSRRVACAARLGPDRLAYYLNQAGLSAKHAGDLSTAREYLSLALSQARDAGNLRALTIRSQNLVDCLGQLGHVAAAGAAAAEAISAAKTLGERTHIRYSAAYVGWVAGLIGDIAEAEQQFVIADRIEATDTGGHLISMRGILWAHWLVLTGRSGPARALTLTGADISRSEGWNDELARWYRILGRLALADGDTVAAGEHLEAASACFREGDYLTELAVTLTDLADNARAEGDLDTAERHVTESIAIAAPRGMLLAHSAALAARARIRAARAATTSNPGLLYQGRDAADAALRLAVRHQLAWHELDALRAHALLDRAEGTDHSWTAKADTLYARLVPPGLDPDPLATVERLVAEQKQEGKS